jgi:hypothetical protein
MLQLVICYIDTFHERNFQTVFSLYCGTQNGRKWESNYTIKSLVYVYMVFKYFGCMMNFNFIFNYLSLVLCQIKQTDCCDSLLVH